jgi:antitoxin component of MazEF toxin-antitoxin module
LAFVDNGCIFFLAEITGLKAVRTIELSDETMNALQSQADARGMSLQAWLENLARQPSAKPRYTLDELLEQCDPQAPMNEEARAWLDAPPVGREAL